MPLPDPEAYVIGYLADHEAVQGVLALAADGKANVSGNVGPPYPACRVFATPAGTDPDPRRLTSPELQVEVWGDPAEPDNLPPLRDALYVVLGALADLPTKDYATGEPVVTAVRSTASGASLPDPITSQPRYLAAVSLTLHPPHSTL